MGPQGYQVIENNVHRDNKSSIILDNNGRASSGTRTRHINIRYFFLGYRVKSREVNIKYFPTYEMIGGYFTNPLQGAKFRKFRDQVLILKSSNDISTPTDGADPQYCVRDWIHK